VLGNSLLREQLFFLTYYCLQLQLRCYFASADARVATKERQQDEIYKLFQI
jgi:hypothetical protein